MIYSDRYNFVRITEAQAHAQGYLYTDTGPLGKYTKRNVLLLKVCQGALQLATANFFASFSVWIGPLFALKKSDENPAVAATEAEHPDNPIHPLVVTHRCPTLFMGLSPQGPSENRSKEAVMSSSLKLFLPESFQSIINLRFLSFCWKMWFSGLLNYRFFCEEYLIKRALSIKLISEASCHSYLGSCSQSNNYHTLREKEVPLELWKLANFSW